MLNIIKKKFLWFTPYTCTLCLHKAADMDLCASCYSLLPHHTNACQQCAQSVLPPATLCPHCRSAPQPFSATFALFTYDPPIPQMIMALKFHQQLLHARILGELMSRAIQNRWYYNKTLPELIIPVPLHPQRLKERGYNQAVEISRPISRLFNIPILLNAIERIKATNPQATLALDKRRNNMRNAFKINNKFTARYVAVVDDVITTGETIKEFCQLLRTQGIEKIDVWCCARTILL